MGVLVSYEWYTDEFGGVNSSECFSDYVGVATRQVDFVCGMRVPSSEAEALAYRRAVCAALDAFAEFGVGQVGGFSLGDFRVTNYENLGTTGEEIANAAITKELAGTSLLFSGVR